MTIKLTKKQTLILDFITDFLNEHGYSPSYREIASGLGISSVSSIAEHVENLVAKGVLRKSSGAARSLELVDFEHPETVKLFREHLVSANDEETSILLQAARILDLDLNL